MVLVVEAAEEVAVADIITAVEIIITITPTTSRMALCPPMSSLT